MSNIDFILNFLKNNSKPALILAVASKSEPAPEAEKFEPILYFQYLVL